MSGEPFGREPGKPRRRRAARLPVADSPVPADGVGDVELLRVLHELQIHEVDLEMQNEELREARAGLEASAVDLTELYDLAPVGYFSLAADGVIRRLNLMGTRMLGGERVFLLGCRFAEFVSGAERHIFDRFLAGVFAGEAMMSCEVTLLRDERAPVVVRLTGILTTDGRSCRLAAMDLTEQRRMEATAREKNEDLDRIFNLSSDLLALVATDGRILRVNPAFQLVLGYDPQSLMNRSFIELVHPDDLGATLQVMAELKAGRSVLDFVNRNRRQDGSFRWLEWRATPSRGDVICALARDITDRRRTEDALRASEEELKRAHTELELKVQRRTAQLQQRTMQLRALASELTLAEERERRRVAGMMHDHLQQLLVAAVQNLAIYRSQYAHADATADLESIESILRESIQATRTLTAELSPAVLHQCGLAAAFRWLRLWCQDKFGLTLAVDVEEEIDPGLDDSVTLFLCVRELLFNIVRHSGVKAATLRMWRTQPDGELKIEVSDEGVGFDPAVVRAREGLTGGFGLFNVRERLEMLGGDLEINSLPGCGSRFTLRLPAQSAVAVPPGAAPGGWTGPPTPGVGMTPADADAETLPGRAHSGLIRLIVADDNPGVRDGLVRVFEAEADFEVVGQAADGQEAVELARQLRPQIVLMDVNMPRMSGPEATRIIRRELPGVQVLGISSHAEVEIRVAMIRAGALDLLPKDHSAAFLVAILRSYTGGGLEKPTPQATVVLTADSSIP